jgi:hypothetical protein
MKTPNQHRVHEGVMGSDDSFGNNGCFIIPYQSYQFKVIASDGMGWEHVSVSLPNRCPNWEEMCHMKSLFWDDDECVVQFHPPKSEYVNNHANCLHLWKPLNGEIELPPSLLVGDVKNNL